MFVVDTNILVYAANQDMREHGECRKLLEGWCNQPNIWHVPWTVLYEFMRVVTHPKVFQQPWSVKEAWTFVETLVKSPGLRVLTETARHPRIAAEMVEAHPFVAGNLIFDLHTAILMREHGIETIYTRDAEFHKFSFLKVIDPLK